MLRSALVLAVAATLAVPGLAHAAAGDLDPSFSGNGKVLTPVSRTDSANGVAVDSQGRIVVAGATDVGKVAVARYLPDGRLDPSFSRDGKVLVSFGDGSSGGRAVAIDSRERVIVAGGFRATGQRRTTDFGVARLTTRGKLDPSFSGDGRVVTHVGGDVSKDVANSVAIDPAGWIVAAGSSRAGGQWDFTLVRYRADGTLDPSFSGDGEVRTAFGEHTDNSASSVAIDSTGRIVAAGVSNDLSAPLSDHYRSAVARYLPGGTLDPAFSGDGRQVLAYTNEQLGIAAVAVDDRNRIVLAGGDYVLQQDSHFAVIRLRPNGALDTTFARGRKGGNRFPGRTGLLRRRRSCWADRRRGVYVRPDRPLAVRARLLYAPRRSRSLLLGRRPGDDVLRQRARVGETRSRSTRSGGSWPRAGRSGARTVPSTSRSLAFSAADGLNLGPSRAVIPVECRVPPA